jgi:hypothetical protein
MRNCIICNRQYEYIRIRTKGKEYSNGSTTKYCNSCVVNIRRFKLRKKIIDYLGGSCVDCGYNKCYGALDAHHLDELTKDFNISGAHCKSWKTIVKELEKCILLCSNCHRERHHDCFRYECASNTPVEDH